MAEGAGKIMARMAVVIVAAAAGILIGAAALVIIAKTGVAGVLFSAVLALRGVWLLVSGWRGRRVGDEPRCAKCGYILLHLASFHCPECGTEISARNTVSGEHRRRWGRMGRGAVFLLVASLPLISPITKGVGAIPWYHFKPAGFVLDDVDVPGTYLKAIRELQRRESAGGLPDRVRRKLVEKALKEQAPATATPRQELLDYLGVALLAGHLTDQEKELFLDQSCIISMTVRPVVREGDQVPYYVSKNCRGPQVGPSPNFWVSYADKGRRIDGKGADSGGSSGSSIFSGGGSSRGSAPAEGIGKHTIEADTDWAVWYGLTLNEAKSQLLGKRSRMTQITYQVVPSDQAPKIELLDSEELRARVVAAVKVDRLGRQKSGYIGIQFKITAAPCDLAFDVVLQTADGETRVGTIDCAKGKTTGYGTGGMVKNVPAKVNVLLRSSMDVAKMTVGANAIYAGDILFRDVEVANEPY